jgi:hypothetical protein
MRNRLALTLLLAALAAVPSAAQESQHGSTLIATDHWSYPFLARLRERGYLTGLNPLVQPYRRADVARELADLDLSGLPGREADWVRLLASEFPEIVRQDAVDVSWGASFEAGAVSASSGRRDPLRPLGGGDTWPRLQLGGWLEAGPIAIESRAERDDFLLDDPDGPDTDLVVGGIADHAYLDANFAFGSVTFGKVSRNWSALGSRGLMLSDVALPYPQLGVELRLGPIRIHSLLGELDEMGEVSRYFAAHRIDYVREDLVVSFGESLLHSREGGGLPLKYLSPATPMFFEHDQQPHNYVENLALDAQVWWRTGSAVLYAEGVLDDIDVSPEGVSAEPTLYAVTFGARVPSLTDWLGAGLEYQRISAWAYRGPQDRDRYSYLGHGLGPDDADVERFTLSVDVDPPLRGLRLTPLVQLQNKGEGDFRNPVPADSIYLVSPGMFLGVKERTVRLGLRGRYQPTRFFWAAWDLGTSSRTNAGHKPSVDDSDFTGLLEVGARLPWPLRRD